MVESWLIRFGLRFKDKSDEDSFFESYFYNRLQLTRVSMVIGAFIYYVFFIWDQIIDPIGAIETHKIRGFVVVPGLLVCAAALGVRELRRWCEAILVLTMYGTATWLAIIYAKLRLGFDYGSVGIVLVLMFAFSMIPIRIPAFVCLCFSSWLTFDAIEAMSGNFTGNMHIINDLCIVTASGLGLMSSGLKELSDRRRFVMNNELRSANARVGEFLETLAPPVSSGAITPVKIFLCYRRGDSSAIVGRMRDRLVRHFGDNGVFMDIDSIDLGENFRDRVLAEIKKSSLVIAVIGPKWTQPTTDSLNRMLDQDDAVRLELEAAMTLGRPIIPVLVGGASMPDARLLPESLSRFPFYNAAEVDDGRDFHQHMDRVVRAIVRAPGSPG